jgi:hypothetical protein
MKMEAKIIIRQATFSDLNAMLYVENEAWPVALRANEKMFYSRIETFPEGNFVAVFDNDLVGFVCTQIIKFDKKNISKTWYEATDNGYIKKTHNYNGDYMYGVSLSVLPSATHLTSFRLLEATGKMAVGFNLKGGILAARIPSYYKYADHVQVEDYVFKRNKRGKFLDPELNIYYKAHLRPVKILKDYINDPDSLNYGVLLEWRNRFYYLGKAIPPLRKWLVKLTNM